MMIDMLILCTHGPSFAALDPGGWIGINSLVILMSLAVASLVFALSRFLSTQYAQKTSMLIKYEIAEAFVSFMLIITMLSFTYASYSAVCMLTTSAAGTQYTDPFQFATSYVANLMFIKGIGLANKMYYTSALLAIDGNVLDYVMNALAAKMTSKITGMLTGATTGGLASIELKFSSGEVEYVYYDFVATLSGLLGSFIIITFGSLFIIFLLLPVIKAVTLTIIMPVAIAMRSLAFTGPQLRYASNTVIALSIAMYFIFPLTLAMDSYVVNWVWCINTAVCNPYVAYLTPYTLNNPVPPGLLSQAQAPTSYDTGGGTPFSLPYNLYSQLFAGNGGVASSLEQLFIGLFDIPGIVSDYTMSTAQYLFQGIVLLALDVAITVGFASGLSKGLDSMSRIVGAGPFW